MIIYQVGNIVVKGLVELETAPSWRVNTTQSANDSRVSFGNNVYPLSNVTEVTITAHLNSRGFDSAQAQFRRLMQFGGVSNLDIIAYDYDVCGCVRWWFTYGEISSVSKPLSIENDVDHIEVTITFSVNPLWEPLDKYFWFPYYGRDVLTPSLYGNIDDASPQKNNFPCKVLPFVRQAKFVFYKHSFTYDFPLLYTSWKDFTEIGQGGGADFLDTQLDSYEFSNTFGSGFNNLIGFTNLPDSGTLTLTVESIVNGHEFVTHESSIDLAELNAILLDAEFGGSGITGNTYILVTNAGVPNTFLFDTSNDPYDDWHMIRSSVTNNVLIPNWTYSYRAPGDMFGTWSKITIERPDENTLVALRVGNLKCLD